MKKGQKMTQEQKLKNRYWLGKTGPGTANWKGNNIGYNRLHAWIRQVYGPATKCESLDCTGEGRRFEWALIEGKSYERNIEHFRQLCSKCHRIYDKQGTKSWITRRLKK